MTSVVTDFLVLLGEKALPRSVERQFRADAKESPLALECARLANARGLAYGCAGSFETRYRARPAPT